MAGLFWKRFLLRQYATGTPGGRPVLAIIAGSSIHAINRDTP